MYFINYNKLHNAVKFAKKDDLSCIVDRIYNIKNVINFHGEFLKYI